ncbi:MAG: hypothetical protein SGARI_005418, partial [Bacillariaceae sp.]
MHEWSPFFCLPKAALTASGLLQLDSEDNEVELVRRSSCIELRHDGLEPMAPCPRGATGKWNNRTSKVLTITITTHRLVLTAAEKNDTRFIHLSNVHVVNASGGPSFQHPLATYKMIVSTYTYGDLVFVVASNASRPREIRDAVQEQIEKSLQRKQWEQAQRLQQQRKEQQQQSKRRVGVDHILTKHKLRHEQASKLADEAVSGDAEQLLTQAGELLQVIQKYSVVLQKYQGSNSTGKKQEDDDAAQRLAGLLSDMGMTSALTKSQVSSSFGGGSGTSADEEYYELTARQIADFLLPRFEKQMKSGKGGGGGGIMSLTDIYCLFNRARGTNLISPEDMRQACSKLGGLNVGLSQRVFPSGVIVI